MRTDLPFTALAVLISLALSICPAIAQVARTPSTSSLAQGERMAVELKQGMPLLEVQKLLGKPRRTALRQTGNATPSQGTLQWTYTWGSSSQDSLQIEFVAKTAEDWYVSSWQWAGY